jgi:ectoine hydroxylase
MATPVNKKFQFCNPLSQEHLDFFEEHGYLHFSNFITRETVEVFRKEMKAIEKQWLEAGIEKVNGVPIKYGFDADGTKIVQRFAFSSQYSSILSEFLKDPRFDALFPLLGPEADNPRIGENEKDGLVINHYINTERSRFSRMGWHTDCIRDVFYGKKIMPMLNVGIHFTDALTDGSGLRILPGTHKQKMMSLLFKKPYFLYHEPDENEIGIHTSAGDLTVHDGRLWHRVAQSSIVGEQSRRQVMYVPLISGSYLLKNENSPTPFYQRFYNIVK